MSFLKGFCSLFDWMAPRTLDEKLQDLYDDMEWGEYKNPLTVDEYIKENPIDHLCEPYIDYDHEYDKLQIFWNCNTDFYVEPLEENNKIELIKNFETNEIVGVNLIGVGKIIKNERNRRKI